MRLDTTFRRGLDWLGLAARLAIGAVFLWAGGSKIGDLPGSVRAVNAYQILPYGVSTVVGSMLPFVEVAVGVLVLVGLATRLAAAVSGVLFAVFVAGIASAWARGLSIDCGCFGGGGELAAGQNPQYGSEIARDVALLALAAVLVWRPVTRWSADGWLAGADDVQGGSRRRGTSDGTSDQFDKEVAG